MSSGVGQGLLSYRVMLHSKMTEKKYEGNDDDGNIHFTDDITVIKRKYNNKGIDDINNYKRSKRGTYQ